LRTLSTGLLAAALAMTLSTCSEWQPFYTPPLGAPVSPTATTTPDANTADNDNDAAAVAIQKANRAAQKAAEAARIAAEASAAARDAAAAAVKATHGTRPALGSSPDASGASYDQPPSGPSSSATRSAAGRQRAASAAPALITDSSTDQRDDAVKSIQAASSAVGRIDRTHLGDADAQRYDLAVSLLDSAQKSLTRKEYAAADSLSRKATILLSTVPGR